MPPPKDLPGFYFDPEKNRYFPIKGRIPGSKQSSSSSSSSLQTSDPSQKHNLHKIDRRKRIKASELLHVRELNGRVLTSNKCRCNFEHEYEKLQASQPTVWKYQGTTCISDSALKEFHGVVQTPEGLKGAHLLAMGSMNGSISLYEFDKVGQYFDLGLEHIPEPVWPPIRKYEAMRSNACPSIWTSREASKCFSSGISCIQRIGKHSPDPADDGSFIQHALVTTLGSGVSGGSVYILNLSEPLSDPGLHGRTLEELTSFDCTIWTADCNSNGTQAVFGTNLGAALVNLETRKLSWVYRTKSDVFSQQFDQSGNVVLCGLRNGAIVAVDVRQKQSGHVEHSAVSSRHTLTRAQRVNPLTLVSHDKRSNKQRFEHKRKSNSSRVVCMSSAVCSLVSLQSDDQYFLGSSMDGSIKLFDLRLLHRGAVQSYDEHVNSHTHLQLGVNPSETLVMSGGEDFCVRIWSIKTGELIFGENVSNSVFTTICWPRFHESLRQQQCYDESSFELTHSWGAWLGSREGLFYMHGS